MTPGQLACVVNSYGAWAFLSHTGDVSREARKLRQGDVVLVMALSTEFDRQGVRFTEVLVLGSDHVIGWVNLDLLKEVAS